MPAVNEKRIDNEDSLEPPSGSTSTSTKENTALRSVALSGMPLHIYPYPALLPTQQPMKSKRRQVKNACTHCQKACKKCDDARPCLRCVKYGISEECVDSQRKERQKGIKRGPYKKRDGGKGVSLSHRRLLFSIMDIWNNLSSLNFLRSRQQQCRHAPTGHTHLKQSESQCSITTSLKQFLHATWLSP